MSIDDSATIAARLAAEWLQLQPPQTLGDFLIAREPEMMPVAAHRAALLGGNPSEHVLTIACEVLDALGLPQFADTPSLCPRRRVNP